MTAAGGEQPEWWTTSGVVALLAQRRLAVACLDTDLRYLAVSPALERMCGRPSDEILGESPVSVAGTQLTEVQQACLDTLATGAATHELPFSTGTDTEAAPEAARHWLLDAFPVPGADGPIGLLVLIRNVTNLVRADLARSAAADALLVRSRSDPLTGLANRTALFAELEGALRSGTRVSLVFCDLDGFKAINDRHGHGAGDQVLRAVARRIRRAARSTDLAVRFGGDEFLVLVRAALDADGLAEIIERYRTAIAQPVYVEGVRFDLGVSVGAAVAGPGDTADDLIRVADHRMYEDKRAGRPSAGR